MLCPLLRQHSNIGAADMATCSCGHMATCCCGPCRFSTGFEDCWLYRQRPPPVGKRKSKHPASSRVECLVLG